MSRSDLSATRVFHRSWSTVLQETGGAGGAITHTPGFAMRGGTGDRLLHEDWLGSTSYTTDNAGVQKGGYAFDAFGRKVATAAGSDGQPQDFMWGGGWGYQSEDAASGLVLMGQRYYDPEVGRFLSPDPIGFGGGSNLYNYVEADPVGGVDPSGLDTLVIYGNNDGVPLSRLAFEFDRPLISPNGTRVIVWRDPRKADVMKWLTTADADDAFFFWGHGDEDGGLLLNSKKESLTVADVRSILSARAGTRRSRLQSATLRSCWSVGTKEGVNEWLKLADGVSGYPSLSGWYTPLPHLNEWRSFRSPIDFDPRERWKDAGVAMEESKLRKNQRRRRR